MAYLARGKKNDLIELAASLDVTLGDNPKIIEIRDAILNSQGYDAEFTKECLNRIINDRKELELRAEREIENTRLYEIEKLKYETVRSNPMAATAVSSPESDCLKIELATLLPKFDPKSNDISLFLELFEKQLKFLNVPSQKWVIYLVGLLPPDIANLIAKEFADDIQEYQTVKNILLKRFKLSSEKYRQLFSQLRKSPDTTWRDFYFDLNNYFNGWLQELNVTTFDDLKNLIVSDQIKKKTPPEYRDHFVDQWGTWNNPLQLADRLDSYEEVRSLRNKNHSKILPIKEKDVKSTQWKGNYPRSPKFQSEQPLSGFHTQRKWETGVPSYSRRNPISNDRAQERNFDEAKEDKNSPYCYGCGAPGTIRPKCRTCNPTRQKNDTLSPILNQANFYSLSTDCNLINIIQIKICNADAAVCADTGATHSVAGEKLYYLLKEKGLKFKEKTIDVTLADGHTHSTEVLTTVADISVQGKVISTELIVLKNARNNRTLLGVNFLTAAGIVLDLKRKCWYFTENPNKTFRFIEAPPNLNALIAVESQPHPCGLRENEGTNLSPQQKTELNSLLKKYENCFEPGGEPTPLVQHHIKTSDHRPISVAPYRLSPTKKQLLKEQIDDLLAKGIIEECDSPYSAPVVLIPKPDGSMRLCVDYRKLNAVTVADTYPLPRMDDLLHQAKPAKFMSTLDLKAGYHQIEVYGPDRDKTTFVCPLGTYRFKRMPYGLRNAPATFQRMMDDFRKAIPNVNILAYLDDMIVLSQTFEEHLSNLETVFERLQTWKLSANRQKCNFACAKVKYLGHWITPNGLEVDPAKVEAITKIPPPKNIKHLQSFLQTCSWYRRFIPNFAQLSKPLSDLTKKKAQWHWGVNEEKAFQTLKQCLVSTPILKQADETKPFTIRTDASSYALGAVLLQGEDAEQHPIEYASRLLTSAERNYSTTEREALAVIWALNKFRGYIDGTEVTVATDHQPLRWLMSLKSPSGRLARWALQLQEFNLKIEHIPGKSNVLADMLSRPACAHTVQDSCEICSIIIDLPATTPSAIRNEQLKDEELQKIIKSFEDVEKGVDYTNWTDRGYLMNQGVLYRYSPTSDSEEAQLVIPSHEREKILKEYHDSPTAGHYGAEGTFNRISTRYYWTGMRSYISNYVKNCPECSRYKPSNQKPSGLLQTPVYSQRFEVLSIDLFGPLPETKTGKRWIFIVEDYATKWVELFALSQATATQCATTLLEEVILRYGLPRRIISDNGSQFVSAVMQQLCFLLGIQQSLTPVYHPQANPVERKNRDLKPRLAILVENDHTSWEDKIPAIRFALNTAKCDTTGETAAFLQFGRELRTTDDVHHDIRAVIYNDNFVPEITPYLKNFANITKRIKEKIEAKQDYRKKYADSRRTKGHCFAPGEKVWVTLHPTSKASAHRTAKFMPKRDGPYVILKQKSPTSYIIATVDKPQVPLATYHVSALTPFYNVNTSPVAPLRKRGRPPKNSLPPDHTQHVSHVPISSNTTPRLPVRPVTRATTTRAAPSPAVSSSGRRQIQRGRL